MRSKLSRMIQGVHALRTFFSLETVETVFGEVTRPTARRKYENNLCRLSIPRPTSKYDADTLGVYDK